MPSASLHPVAATSIYQPQAANVLSVRDETHLEKHFELQLDTYAPLGHEPGQFVQVSIPGVGECPISICSSPTIGLTFELTVRRVGEVTNAIHRLKEGDQVGVRGPFGKGFDTRAFQGCDTLIIAGGCGLAPARSLIQYILDERNRFGKFYLLYGARSPQERLFKEELAAWESSPLLQFLQTVDNPDDQWKGRTGVVTKLFRELPPLQPEKTRVAVIGPPVMFKFVMLELLGRSIPEDHIYCSLERRMKCGIGKCGHCQVNHLYACLDGPVFRYSDIATVREAIE